MAKAKVVAATVDVPVELPTEVPVEVAPKIDFEVWFATRAKHIPEQHLREIVWADFRGRGLSAKETVAAFDAALAEYGIRL